MRTAEQRARIRLDLKCGANYICANNTLLQFSKNEEINVVRQEGTVVRNRVFHPLLAPDGALRILRGRWASDAREMFDDDFEHYNKENV